MKRNFDDWMKSFSKNISSYDYYVDFEKVYKNIEQIKVELNVLNSLVGDKNIEENFEKLLRRFPEIIKCIPILLAVRLEELHIMDDEKEIIYNFDKPVQPIEQYKVFMEETGLFDLISNHIINNLVDYVTGVETGLDSNGRKNRGGHLMEDIVEKYIKKAGFLEEKNYFKEMYIHDIEKKWGVNLSNISNNGKAEKRFDFVVKTDNQIYVIEVNFYTTSGSKLNETARSYKQLSQEIDEIDGVTFVWFTDGSGWQSARNNLEETFDVMPNIYNINDLKNGIIREIIK